MPMTMKERYDHAAAALQAYNKAKGEASPDLSQYYEISDLICDLLHLATSKSFQKDEVLETALMHYEGEQEENAGSSDIRRIAELNDLCRKAMGTAGRVMQTEGFNALLLHVQSAIHEKVETFNNFTSDNDPHGEHDFGAVEHEGDRIFWKIDYYALDMMHGSENPADPKQTSRVLTLMLAEEY
jgi:hypothetical protein